MERRNKGNYTHSELEITEVVQDGQDQVTAIKTLKDLVYNALYELGEFSPTGEVQLDLLVVSEEPKKEVAAPVVVKPKVEKVKKVEAPKVEIEKQVEVTIPDKKPLDKPEVVAELTKVIEKKVEAKKVTVKTKAVAYDRILDSHKSLIGSFLDASAKGWRDQAILKHAGVASRELQGKDFLDSEGEILESFKTEFLKVRSESWASQA